MNWKQTVKQCCSMALMVALMCPYLYAGSPADDDPGMYDGYKKMMEGEEAYKFKQQQQEQKQKGGQQGSTVIDTIANAPNKVYGTDETGQLADSVAGTALEKLGGKILGNVPVSDAAETAGKVAGGDYDGAAKTFVKGVFSTVIAYGSTLILAPTAPAWVPIVVAGTAAYGTKKLMDYILNVPGPEPYKKGITIGAAGEPGPADTTSQEQKPTPPVIEGPDGPVEDQDAPPAADGPDDGPDSGPGKPISIEDIANQEPTAGATPDGDTPSTSSGGKNVLDGLVNDKQESSKANTDSSFKLASQNTKINKASTAGDSTTDSAKQTVDQAGGEAQSISDESASASASADSASSWSSTMGDALQTGLTAGGVAMGSAVGAAAASKAGNEVFGDPSAKKNTESETTEETDGGSTTTSSETSSSSSSSGDTPGGGTPGGPPGGTPGGGQKSGGQKSNGSSGGSSSGSASSGSSAAGTTSGTSSSGSSSSTPTSQTQTAGTFTAKIVPSASSYYIQVTGVSSNNLSATVTGTDGYSASFSGVGSITSSTIPAGDSGVNDTVTAKDVSTGETASFNFTF